MKKTMFALAAGLMASATAAQAGGLLPRLQPVTAAVMGLTTPALAGLSAPVQPKEGEPRFGLPAFPDLAVPELPYIDVPGIPSDQLYWVGHWLDDTVNWYARDTIRWATDHAPAAGWDELDIVLGMAGAGDLGGAGNRMTSFGKKFPSPPKPVMPDGLGLSLQEPFDATWDATIGAVFGEQLYD